MVAAVALLAAAALALTSCTAPTPAGSPAPASTDGGVAPAEAPEGVESTARPAAAVTSTHAPTQALTHVVMMLDWVPNTNHTGIFVAQAEGYFQDEGLDVEIIQPGEVFAEQAVVGGVADFGIGFQEQVTMARSEGVPLVSIAAILQHNSSGFAALEEHDATRPAAWEGLTYGSYGGPFEQPTLEALMECDGGDYEQLKTVEIGLADPLALLTEGQIDLAWIFIGWQGVQARLEGVALDVVMMEDWFDCVPDYYTPVIVASERAIEARPELVRSFLRAVSRGYELAIEDPEAGATILLEQVPELDESLVRESQAWLSPRYRADAPRWGQQELAVWAAYSEWMAEQGIINEPIEVGAAFTNEYLPPAAAERAAGS
jgi:ABC-type nitrate/sulfonate/bicarbonate transport system substrate-binding protein